MAPAMDMQTRTFYSLNNEPLNLNEGRSGKLLIFFQTWCGPCIKELRVWSNYLETHRDIRVYAITDESPAEVKPLLRIVHPEISIAYSRESLRSLQIYSFPTAYYFPAGSKTPLISKVGAILPSDIH